MGKDSPAELAKLRWQGIDDTVCPNAIPDSADCSSLITWIYWTAFGKGPDYLNNANWGWGYTATMMHCPDLKPPVMNPFAHPVAFDSLQPGDVCIRGEQCSKHMPSCPAGCRPTRSMALFLAATGACPGNHAVMYLGLDDNGQAAFLSFGGPGYSGDPYKWWWHVDRRNYGSEKNNGDVSPDTGYSCRTYPDFFAVEAGGAFHKLQAEHG